MDVAQWLNGIGLRQYEALFREHEIDADVLPDLTEADLEKIGVPLGHRKRLMRAIAALASNEAPPPAPKPAPVPSSPARAFSGTDAERRPITVMFCDLVGSTSLAARLDAEDWRNLVGAYLDEASAAVTGLGGHVLKKLGDGLMALFGYPQAQENDAERAVRAALAIQRALADLNARNARTGAPALEARIGLDMGPVVVDAAGEVFGEAPNVAARVQATAEPGTVLVTAAVQRQTAGLFVAEDKGAHELKGVPAAVTVYRIVRASSGRRGGARALTPLVGREEELEHLSRRWEKARKGEGQLALVVGEPGIGKSRLIEEFRARLGETPHTWSEWSSSQLLQNTPLHPIAEWGRLRFGADLPGEQRLADLENTLRLTGLDATEYAPLLAPLVDIPLPEERTAKFAPEELRRRQLAAMTTWVLAGARSQPIALAFEDLHWADPTSLDLMRTLAERGAQAPLFIIATTRPEFRPPWSLRSHHGVISLAPLDRAQVRRMVGEIASRHALPDDVIDGVGERTGGVPLFVEEVTRLLLERGERGGAQAIPPTLQQSLAARLDRLGEAREVAQIGAVLGRGFSHGLLQAASGLDEAGLHSALERLAESDLLIAEGAGPQANYRFKHALIQDAAYESLLKSRRQALHRRAAEILLGQPERAAAEPEAIAHHFTQASLDDLAIEWWGKAGDQALRRSAFQEAISHLGKAIAMADAAANRSRPEAAGRSELTDRRFKLESTFAPALGLAKGFEAEDAKLASDRIAHALATDSGADFERAIARQVHWATAFNCGEMASAREAAESFLKAAEGARTLPGLAAARRSMGATLLAQGDLAEASKSLEQAMELADRSRDLDRIFGTGPDPGASAASHLSLASWMLGAPDRSRELIDEAITRTERIEHIPTQTVVRYFAAVLEMLRGDARACLPLALSMIDFCRDRRVRAISRRGNGDRGLGASAPRRR